MSNRALFVNRTVQFVAVLASLSCGYFVLADGKPGNKPREKQDNQRIQNAQKALDGARQQASAAEKRLREAQQQFTQADSRLDKAKVVVQKAKEAAESKLEDSTGIKQAIDQMKAAQANFDQAAEPVLAKLQAQHEYQQASRAAEMARVHLKTIGSDDTLSDAVQEAEISAINKTLQLPRQLELAACESDSRCKQAQAKLMAAQEKVAQLREKVRDRIEQHPEVRSGLKTLDGATTEFAQAKTQVTAAQQQLLKERRELATKQQQLEQAKAADKRNDNKGKNQKK